MPSSLILRTGPKRLATRAAVVRAPSTTAEGDAVGAGQRVGVVAEDGAEGQQAAGQVGHEGAVEAGEGFEDGGVELGHVAAAGEVVDRTLGQGLGIGWHRRQPAAAIRRPDRHLIEGVEDAEEGERPGGGFGIDRVVGPVPGGSGTSRTSWGAIRRPMACEGSETTTSRPPWRSSARSRAVWKSTRASEGIAHHAFPQGEFRFRVEHPPAAMSEDERLDAAGEDLDLLVRAEHQADVAARAVASAWNV